MYLTPPVLPLSPFLLFPWHWHLAFLISQANFNIWAFRFPVSSAWHVIPLDIYINHSFTSYSFTQSSLLSKVSLGLLYPFCFFSQITEFFIERGLNKESTHTVLEYRGDIITPQTISKYDSSQSLVVPVMPPTLKDVCRLLHIYYVLKVKYCF